MKVSYKLFNKYKIPGAIKELAILAGVAILMAWFFCPQCFNSFEDGSRIFFYYLIVWLFAWKGNEYISKTINTKYSWIKQPVKALAVGIPLVLSYTIVLFSCINILYYLLFKANEWFFTWRGFSVSMYFSIGITFIIHLILYSKAFLLHWKEAALKAERLEKENAIAHYESLKNQVNPHFLFNSLNVLTGLVYENQDLAVKFIRQLSDVYRYVLQNQQREVVTIAEEEDFLKSFLFLCKIRYQDGFKFMINFNIDKQNFIPPLSLQILIENAIKHNIISEEEPLLLEIYSENDYLAVKNNHQRKTIAGESNGLGLKNIQARYQYLTEKQVIINETNEHFEVKIPIIYMADHHKKVK